MSRQYLQHLFKSIDRNNTGRINAQQVKEALSKGAWNIYGPFESDTYLMMMELFDTNNDRGIDMEGFDSLWNFVGDWFVLFRLNKPDTSGTIDKKALINLLCVFGVKRYKHLYDILVKKFDNTHKKRINFDDFVSLCIVLQTLEAAFREKDTDKDGWIRIDFEELVTMFFSMKMYRSKLSLFGGSRAR